MAGESERAGIYDMHHGRQINKCVFFFSKRGWREGSAGGAASHHRRFFFHGQSIHGRGEEVCTMERRGDGRRKEGKGSSATNRNEGADKFHIGVCRYLIGRFFHLCKTRHSSRLFSSLASWRPFTRRRGGGPSVLAGVEPARPQVMFVVSISIQSAVAVPCVGSECAFFSSLFFGILLCQRGMYGYHVPSRRCPDPNVLP